MKRKTWSYLAVILVVFLLSSSGCATIIKGRVDDIDIESIPKKAQVYINGELAGETPLTVTLASNQTHVIEFKKEGFEDETYVVHNHLGAGWLVLDIFFWPGLIVDAITGDWYVLDDYEVSARLKKRK